MGVIDICTLLNRYWLQWHRDTIAHAGLYRICAREAVENRLSILRFSCMMMTMCLMVLALVGVTTTGGGVLVVELQPASASETIRRLSGNERGMDEPQENEWRPA